MTKVEQRAETAALVRKARFGKAKLAITRLPDAVWERDSCIRYKNGHMLPAHLNPVTMGDKLEGVAS